jgi:hypothetical protein
MTFRSGRVSAMAAAVITLGTLTGALMAAPASASDASLLCIDLNGGGDYVCAVPNGTGEAITAAGKSSDSWLWVFPGVNATNYVTLQDDSTFCMQVDHSAGNVVRGANCVGDSAEKWTNKYVDGATQLKSSYDGGCLTLADVDGTYALYDKTCSAGEVDQEWVSGD